MKTLFMPNDNSLDRPEIQLADLSFLLKNKLVFSEKFKKNGNQNSVNIKKTNSQLVLKGKKLSDFRTINIDEKNLATIKFVSQNYSKYPAEKIWIILLCGGLSSRSMGKVNPLMTLEDKRFHKKTLIDLKIEQIINSCMGSSKIALMASISNEENLRDHFLKNDIRLPELIYTNGSQKRLSLHQPSSGELNYYIDNQNNHFYNPEGHMGVLRWLVASGAITYMNSDSMILIASYSNWGDIFNSQTLKTMQYIKSLSELSKNSIIGVEVTKRLKNKKTGSILSEDPIRPGRFFLLKQAYGVGIPKMPDKYEHVLMGTNTWYVPVKVIINRLKNYAQKSGIKDFDKIPKNILKTLQKSNSQKQLLNLFDNAFPSFPYLSLKKVPNDEDTLQLEHDLDQLSLIDGINITPIIVPSKRAISFKRIEDIENKNEIKGLLDGLNNFSCKK